MVFIAGVGRDLMETIGKSWTFMRLVNKLVSSGKIHCYVNMVIIMGTSTQVKS